jgi:SH3-like domain-containing protein
MRILTNSMITALAIAMLPATASAAGKPPYWASITAGEARMRTGPGRQFPASWMYKRKMLPVKVVAVYQGWRKIEDPDGTQGWMQSNLLSDQRTGLVLGELRPLRDKPDASGNIIMRAEPGVVGVITECRRGWCKIDVMGRMGYIEIAHLWGLDPGEASR